MLEAARQGSVVKLQESGQDGHFHVTLSLDEGMPCIVTDLVLSCPWPPISEL